MKVFCLIMNNSWHITSNDSNWITDSRSILLPNKLTFPNTQLLIILVGEHLCSTQ
jgi:hypothetical protein